MNTIYDWLVEYLKDKKKVVEYLYILHHFFSLYWNNIYNYIKQISSIDEQLWEVLKFCKEEKYSKKDLYELLMYSIQKSWFNIFDIKLWKWLGKINLNEEWEQIIEKIDNDAWLYVRSADNKIYKRFVLDDVRKLLWM